MFSSSGSMILDGVVKLVDFVIGKHILVYPVKLVDFVIGKHVFRWGREISVFCYREACF